MHQEFICYFELTGAHPVGAQLNFALHPHKVVVLSLWGQKKKEMQLVHRILIILGCTLDSVKLLEDIYLNFGVFGDRFNHFFPLILTR